MKSSAPTIISKASGTKPYMSLARGNFFPAKSNIAIEFTAVYDLVTSTQEEKLRVHRVGISIEESFGFEAVILGVSRVVSLNTHSYLYNFVWLSCRCE